MASLVDSRPNPSIPLPQTPPIKTTTNTLPPLQPQASPSTPSTHLDIPGSFPHEASRPAPKQNASETSRGQSYFPTNLKPASYLLGAKGTSLPSSEKEGVKPGEHYDGVGPLPGTISETSVAKLPDERLQSAREADQPSGKRVVEAGPASLPSQDTKGVQPYERHGGVGPLPGSRSETSVAKFPDERAGATAEERSGTAASAQELSVAPPESRGPVPYPPLDTATPETQVQSIDPQGPASVQKALERDDQGADVKEGVPADSKFRDEVAAEEKNLKRDLEKKEERKREAVRAAEESTSQKQDEVASTMSSPTQPASPTQRKGRSGRASSDSDASHHKKASVMNMVKGEMKVLLGKASRNKGKVEEGEKLKHGSD